LYYFARKSLKGRSFGFAVETDCYIPILHLSQTVQSGDVQLTQKDSSEEVDFRIDCGKTIHGQSFVELLH